MRIGIDIDDVITDTSLTITDYIVKYDRNGEILEHIEEVMRGEMPTQGIKKFFDENSIKIFESAKLKKDVSKVTRNFLDTGHEIFLITSRGDVKFKGSERLTLEYLKNNDVSYSKILFNSFDKAKVCKENYIDIMVDDSAKYCTEISKENIKSVLFTSEVNKLLDVDVQRVSSWLELERIINEMCK